ncbi:MAG: hypothetical protein A3J48_02215 [Candidatus Doudnabacteria bacterium RIFCSPHIGHO2_02_FULL_46_11]|uniref:Uncharacterized protein n=1 Tax=Candidatus Doudnabacteria bacterium RIFCSPHIGHO2_02_FULL_46_11 TaxID=1817832 RepID=A0A1F5P4W9_9BACT|nr:MAG: hypothetical protein A3J48_02215 [Candidatus Doudnabacteria bacterium RIFCSPHIGHO2_02_FULL_46_11]
MTGSRNIIERIVTNFLNKRATVTGDVWLMPVIARVRFCIFDKSILTDGKPVLTDLLTANAKSKRLKKFINVEFYDETKLLSIAASLAKNSEHAKDQAILRFAKEKKTVFEAIDNVSQLPDRGLKGTYKFLRVLLGSISLLNQFGINTKAASEAADKLSAEGKTVSILSVGEEIKAIFAFREQILTDSLAAMLELKKLNIITILVTGESKAYAQYLTAKASLDYFYSELSEHKKTTIIQKFKNRKVTLVASLNPELRRLGNAGLTLEGFPKTQELTRTIRIEKLAGLPGIIKISRKWRLLFSLANFFGNH